MRLILLLLLLLPTGVLAEPDRATLEALRDGSIKKLVFTEEPAAVSDVRFSDLDGGDHALADFRGSYILVNFWATWCAPCRVEMPSLDRLQRELGGDGFRVLTIATGPNTPTAIRRFFEEEGITALPLYADPKQRLARDMGVLGMPTTVLIDPEGREIARLRGDAEWDSPSALAIVSALTDGRD